MKRISAIYSIRSIIKPGRIYIGSAVDIKERWRLHRKQLKENKHHSLKLQRHYNKYGKDDLMFTILMSCDKVELIEKEQFFIDAYKPYFNISPTAGSSLGVIRTEEYKMKVSKGRKGILHTEQWKYEMSQRVSGDKHPMYGKKHTEESILKMKKKHKPPKVEFIRWNKGKKGLYHHSDEIKEKLRIANTGENNPRYGKHHTEEHKRKISEAEMGRKMSEETKRKLSDIKKGRPAWNKGRKLTDEQKQRISNAKTGLKRGPYKIKQISLN